MSTEIASVRFCTSCQSDRSTEGGVYKPTRRTARWICKSCVERKTESIYKNRSGKPADVAKIMSYLLRKRAA